MSSLNRIPTQTGQREITQKGNTYQGTQHWSVDQRWWQACALCSTQLRFQDATRGTTHDCPLAAHSDRHIQPKLFIFSAQAVSIVNQLGPWTWKFFVQGRKMWWPGRLIRRRARSVSRSTHWQSVPWKNKLARRMQCMAQQRTHFQSLLPRFAILTRRTRRHTSYKFVQKVSCPPYCCSTSGRSWRDWKYPRLAAVVWDQTWRWWSRARSGC